MTAICMAESHGNYNAIDCRNYDGKCDFGILQLHNQRIYDPKLNVEAGHRIWLRQGYEAWTSYNNGSYRQYLL